VAKVLERETKPVQNPEEIRVGSQTQHWKLAQVLELALRQHGRAAMVGIGPKAIATMVQAAIRARGKLVERGFDLRLTPAYTDVQIDAKERTAVRLQVEVVR